MTAGAVRHFSHLSDDVVRELFLESPEAFSDRDDRDVLAASLGATLYVPAIRPDLTRTVVRRAADGVCSMVLDLEDAIGDHEVEQAVANTVKTLDALAVTPAANALIFVRVRTPETIRLITDAITSGVTTLSGFVVPKFDTTTGAAFLDEVDSASGRLDKPIYSMPVLESHILVHAESRDAELQRIGELLTHYRRQVLAVRIGATDMSGIFGIRRDRDLTVYDVRVVADVIADIVNYFGRSDGTGYVITGPVWEYFADRERMFRPLLRTTPFAEHDAVLFRQHLVSRDLDGLLREIALDRANGLHGKTVIHPSHVAPVHALSAVTHEEYQDALDILDSATGAQASGYRNKMNETKPHQNWARQTTLRARAFGVTNTGVTFVDLLTALVDA
ncbi:ATP/GTP-binding protein [Mycobacterium antarcticum]|uniref:HpcH/HpaI aldolase/citrate lyase family protein n=1 Tax=Mycolicibacterium sp. TUM20983 TaxID=3023369 RepID=UPI0023A15D80|nr:HpcH/HpaI aldolase/citrate lyase family protein [Mycolicibacterium sp. TUM20983]GLP72934.1 ATP/GTP-binding protein [Mycolicibacterium sp. TUM20983]